MRIPIRQAGLLLGLALFLLGLAGCSAGSSPLVSPPSSQPSAASSIRFSEDILPLIRQKFAPLLEQETGLQLDSWEGLIAGSDFGQILIPFDAEHSLLIKLATRLNPPHPSQTGSDALTPDEIDRVRRWIDDGARNDDGAVPYADAENLLYVCNQDAALISVVDMDANVVVRSVKLADYGFAENAKPHHTAVEPDGSHWYVSLIGAGKVLKFNRANELVGQADFETPGMLALHPTEDALYVGRSMMAVTPPQRVGIIRRRNMKIEELDVFFPRPHALALTPDGRYAYTASLAENRIATVERATDEVSLTSLDGDLHTLVQFAVSPDGRTMIVGGQMTGQVLVFDLSAPSEPALAKTIPVGAAPWHPVFRPDGQEAYLGNKMANTVTVLDMENRSVAAVIEGYGLSQPHGSAVSPDGRTLYVSNNNLNGAYTPRYAFGPSDDTGTLVVIDTESREIKKVLELERYPSGVGTR